MSLCHQVSGHYWQILPVPRWAAKVCVHADCICNEHFALVTRVFPASPPMSPRAVVGLARAFDNCAWSLLGGRGVVRPWTYDEFIDLLPSRKRRLYSDALLELERGRRVTSKDARIRSFVKAEKIDDAHLKVLRGAPVKPRLIQARRPIYNLSIAIFIKAIERRVYGWTGPYRGVCRSRIFAKGLSLKRRAAVFQRKLSGFESPVVLSVDAHAFDACVQVEHLRATHRFYQRLLPHSGFQRLLSYQLSCKARSKNGIRYEVAGKRMSGDMDTSLGNCLVMVNVVATVMNLSGCRKWDLLNDGDDCLVVVESSEGRAFCETFRVIGLELGFRLDAFWCGQFDDWALEDIVFCRHRLVCVGGVWRFVRDARRAVGGLFMSHRHYHHLGGLRVLKGMAKCELVHGNIPCTSVAAWHVYQLLGGYKLPKNLKEFEFAYGLNLSTPTVRPVVAHTTRVSYSRAFGVSIHEQLLYENAITKLTLSQIDPTGCDAEEPMLLPALGTLHVNPGRSYDRWNGK